MPIHPACRIDRGSSFVQKPRRDSATGWRPWSAAASCRAATGPACVRHRQKPGARLSGCGTVIAREIRRRLPRDHALAPTERPGQDARSDEIQPRVERGTAALHGPLGQIRAASTNCGSFIVTSACSGVLVRSRRTVQISRVGALKIVHRSRRRAALPERVQAAPIEVVAVILFVEARVAALHGDGFPDALRLVGLHAGAADLSGPAGRWLRARNRAPFRHPCGSADRARAGGCRDPFELVSAC